MRIVGATSSASAVTRQTASHDTTLPEPQATALTVEPPHRNEGPAQFTRHPSAPFVAHLIATRMQAPQTRARRRAEPDEATAVYRSMTKPVAQRRMFGTKV